MLTAKDLRKQADYHRRLAETLETAAIGISAVQEGANGEVVFANAAAPKVVGEAGGAKRGRGRPKGAKNKPKDEAAAAPVKKDSKVEAKAIENGGKKLPDLILGLLKANKQGLRVPELVQKALESGYKTDSKKENGFTACVYQAIHKLSKAEQISKDGKCYKLIA